MLRSYNKDEKEVAPLSQFGFSLELMQQSSKSSPSTKQNIKSVIETLSTREKMERSRLERSQRVPECSRLHVDLRTVPHGSRSFTVEEEYVQQRAFLILGAKISQSHHPLSFYDSVFQHGSKNTERLFKKTEDCQIRHRRKRIISHQPLPQITTT